MSVVYIVSSCTCVYACGYYSGLNFASPYSTGQGLYSTWSSFIWLGWHSSESHGSSYLCHTLAFSWVQGSEPKFSCLCREQFSEYIIFPDSIVYFFKRQKKYFYCFCHKIINISKIDTFTLITQFIPVLKHHMGLIKYAFLHAD